jgi:RNA polymerase sigma factor (TIGR02999 family)
MQFCLCVLRAFCGENQVMTPEDTPSSEEITRLLHGAQRGDRAAADKLIPMVYGELRRLARHYLSNERPDHTLQPTALVNDALLQLLEIDSIDWQNREHFFGVAANAMRRILIDHARRHKAEKRGGELHQVELDSALALAGQRWDEVLAVHEALDRLEKFDPPLGKIVELRYFGGMTEEETAEVLGVSARTVKRKWQVARAWLFGEMTK